MSGCNWTAASFVPLGSTLVLVAGALGAASLVVVTDSSTINNNKYYILFFYNSLNKLNINLFHHSSPGVLGFWGDRKSVV